MPRFLNLDTNKSKIITVRSSILYIIKGCFLYVERSFLFLYKNYQLKDEESGDFQRVACMRVTFPMNEKKKIQFARKIVYFIYQL